MREDLIERLRERAQFEDKRVLDEAKAMGFEPEVYTGSRTGALLREAAAAIEAAREDATEAKQNGYELGLLAGAQEAERLRGVIARYERKLDAAIDQARGKGEP